MNANPGGAWRADLDLRLAAHRARQAERRSDLRPVTLAPPAAPALPCAPIVLAPVGAPEPVAEPMRRAAAAPPAPESWSSLLPPLPGPEPNFDLRVVPARRPGIELAEPVSVPPRRFSAPLLPRVLDPDAVLRIPLPLSAPRVAVSAAVPARVKPAPRRLRLAAGLYDGGIVLAASLAFALAAWAAAGFAPPDAHTLHRLLPALAAVPLWLAFLYRLGCAARGGTSPGMQRHGLELAGFDAPPSARARRRRALFGFFSLAALGGGYLWMFLDSDRLTWHDYISRTYPRRAQCPLASDPVASTK